MTSMTVVQLIAAAQNLTLEEQRVLNSSLVAMINSNRRIKAAVAGSELRIGQVVRFDAKSKGIKHLKIEKFNRARTAVVGYECLAGGHQGDCPKVRWTVANTICVPV